VNIVRPRIRDIADRVRRRGIDEASLEKPMPWYRLNLGAADLANAARTAASVDAAWREAGCPASLAAYTRHESDGRLHCDLVVYFTPDSDLVARELGARPCPDPGPYDLTLLAGGSVEAGDEPTA
jgi:hypothetical protein